MFSKCIRSVFLLISAFWLWGCQTQTKVSKDSFDGLWPFSVDEGEIACQKGSALTFSANGKVYGLNGLADSWFDTEPLEDIWLPNPEIEGLRIGIQDVQRAAEALCK